MINLPSSSSSRAARTKVYSFDDEDEEDASTARRNLETTCEINVDELGDINAPLSEHHTIDLDTIDTLTAIATTALHSSDLMKDAVIISNHVMASLRQTKIEPFLERMSSRDADENFSLIEIEPRPFLHVWDCGSQSILLELLPMFLTSRTLFLLVFDASRSLHEPGCDTEHDQNEDIDETALDMLLKWMAMVHANFMKYNDDGSLPDYPRMFCVGTKGNDPNASRVQQELKNHYEQQPYVELIEDTLTVKDTQADPNICRLREAIQDFATKKVKAKIPLNWVLFRKMLQSYEIALNKKFIDMNEAEIIAAACKIPIADLPNVIGYYQDLGEILHFPNTVGLRDKVFIDSKWFIDVLSQPFIYEDKEESRTKLMRQLFRSKGILVQPYYATIWSGQLQHISPDSMMELLVLFRLAAQVQTNLYPNPYLKQYFVPAILKQFKGDHCEAPPNHHLRATPLHVTFASGYVPPGFFTRLVVSIIINSSLTVEFCDKADTCIYKNRVVFYDKIDRIILTKLQHLIHVDVRRYVSYRDLDTPFNVKCQEFLTILTDAMSDVDTALLADKCSRIRRTLNYICDSCPVKDVHYLIVSSKTTEGPVDLVCQVNGCYRKPTPSEDFWFQVQKVINNIQNNNY